MLMFSSHARTCGAAALELRIDGNILPIGTCSHAHCTHTHTAHKFRKFMFNLLNRLIRFISFRGAHTRRQTL